MRLAVGFIQYQELSRVVFDPPYMDHFDGPCLKEHK